MPEADRGVRTARRARRSGSVLLGLGIPVAVIGGVLVALVLSWIPLAALLPDTVRVTGPVVADWRATFWVGFVLVVGLAATAQGVHQRRVGRPDWMRLVVQLLIGTALLAAAVLARFRP